MVIFLREFHREYCRINQCPYYPRSAPPPRQDHYTNAIYSWLATSYWLWTEKGIPPTIDLLGSGGQNPLFILACEMVAGAEHRKREWEKDNPPRR